ncbi:MAG: hypothetical protein ACYTDT_08555 [Planctomycetota bacterium]|jgi:hypothetical protein
MWKWTALVAVAMLLVTASSFDAQRIIIGGKKIERVRKNPGAEPEKDAPKLPTLSVFEWGVQTINFDGTAQDEENLPAHFHKAEDIKLEVAPVQPLPEVEPPVPGPRPGPQPGPIRKPVLYFECAKDCTFDLDVRFASGKLTWVYPAANRRTNSATMQWDNIKLYSDAVTARDKFAPPTLPEIEADHWAAYSRDGSESTLVVNGESERYLFYEGERAGLPEVDIYRNADGAVVVANYTGHVLADVRLTLKGERWYVKQLPAMAGSTAGTVVLDDSMKADGTGDIAAETVAAGLKSAQGKVFARAWQKDFDADNTLSWRRSQKALDELMELKLTMQPGMGSEVKRVGYVMLQGVDLEGQGEFEALVNKARGGDADAVKVLNKGGVLAVGAVRRAMESENVSLKERMALAKLLGAMAE